MTRHNDERMFTIMIDTDGKRAPRLKDMALNERPQERLEQYGSATLKDSELLAMLLRSGSSKMDVMALSSCLMSDAGSLATLISWSKEDFMSFPGIGNIKALQLMTVMEISRRVLADSCQAKLPFNDPEKVYEYLRPYVMGLEVEKFWTLCLNRKNRLIKCVEVTSGTATSSLVHPREVYREAIRLGSSAIIVVHNHPSGDPSPSSADIRVTRQLREAADVVGIGLLDHVIIGEIAYTEDKLGFYSFNDNGLL